MEQPQFINGLFIDDNLLNAMAGIYRQSFEDIGTGLFSPGLMSPSNVSFSISNLVVTVTAALPFRVLFGNGVLAGPYGTTDGATSDVYTVNFASLVPSSGSVTAYLAASTTQIQQTPVTVIGPPKGHPDYNPANAPFQFYSTAQDSLALTATTTAPDNSTTFEIGRVTLTAGQTSISSIDTSNQVQGRGLQIVQVYAGDPNGNVAGTQGSSTAQPSVVWDSTDALLWVCKTTGDSANAVWRACAPLDSPVFTGTPTAPTAAAGTANTQLANTQWVNSLGAPYQWASSVISGAGLTPDRTNTAQLLTAIPLLGRYSFDAASPPASPIALAVGDKCTITFEGADLSSRGLPMNIAVSEGVYRLSLVVYSSDSNNSDCSISPNDTSYSGAFSAYQLGQADFTITSFGSSTTNVGTTHITSSPYLFKQNVVFTEYHLSSNSFGIDLFNGPSSYDNINDRGPFTIEILISTFTKGKMLRHSSGIRGTPAIGFSTWNDTTTPWTSLGIFYCTYGTSFSGTMFIERLV